VKTSTIEDLLQTVVPFRQMEMRTRPFAAALLIWLSTSFTQSGGLEHRPIESVVHHYEGLDYSPHHVDHQHRRHKRSLPQDGHRVALDFSAHGRDFKLRLKRDHSVFHNSLVVEDGWGRPKEGYDLSHVYDGRCEGPAGGAAFGSLHDGIFDGQVETRHGTYFIERAHKYFKDDSNDSFHSVIYHERHLRDPFRHSKAAGFRKPGCGVSDDVRDWMDHVQNSGEVTPPTPPTTVNLPNPPPTPSPQVQIVDKPENVVVHDPTPLYKYSAEANDPKVRRKRALANNSNKKSCSLYIQTDPLFWEHIYKQEKEDAGKTDKEILSLIAQHVKAVNRIYLETSFDGKYTHNGYQFEVQRIKIHNMTQCDRNPFDTEHNQFCVPNIDVSNFLNLHSKTKHDEFCLAYVFTYRDFTGGTLGLAWVASATGASGGICETYKSYKENINNSPNTTKRSLNTGIITFVNYNSRVPPKVSQLTLAHEIGHNFGSPHDYPAQCRPGGQEGNYIMFASATSGDRFNNNKFSECSKTNVSRVLDAITDGLKPKNCFKEKEGAFCGNKIVEPGEECDCGFDEHECQEQCCHPRQSSNLSESDNKKFRCKRKQRAECSPSEGPCCGSDCKFIEKNEDVMCKVEEDCTEAARCDGTAAMCPNPAPKPDNVTECNEGTQVCQKGECTDSICLKYDLSSCFLTSDKTSDKRRLCDLACQYNNTCVSTKELAEKYPNLGAKSLSLRPGSPCDEYQGYCDVFLKCRKVDAEGPLVRLKNLLLNEKTLLTIAQWVTEFWWAVLLMGIAFVIFMACFIRCFAIHTPSSNPRLPKNLHFTETLRRPARALKQQHGYRAANSGHGAPPPYPGRGGGHGGHGGGPSGGGAVPRPGSSAIPGGPGRGYGEGRGHYNRSKNEQYNPNGSSHPMNQMSGPHGASRGGGREGGANGSGHIGPRDSRAAGGPDRSSRNRNNGNRGSRIEMSPLR